MTQVIVSGNAREYARHVPHGYLSAGAIWWFLASQGLKYLSFNAPLNEWIVDNVKGSHNEPNWSTKYF